MENPYFLFFVKFADIIFIFAWRHTINLFKSPIKGSLAGETWTQPQMFVMLSSVVLMRLAAYSVLSSAR